MWMEETHAVIANVFGDVGCNTKAIVSGYWILKMLLHRSFPTTNLSHCQPERGTTCELADRKSKCVCTHSETFPLSLTREANVEELVQAHHTFIHTRVARVPAGDHAHIQAWH